MAIRLGAAGDLTDSANVAWKYSKGTAYVPSPILYGDYLYLTTDRGILTCLNAKTGELEYEGGRVPIPATFTASPVAFDGKILLTSEDGDTFMVKAGPKHEILGSNSSVNLFMPLRQFPMEGSSSGARGISMRLGISNSDWEHLENQLRLRYWRVNILTWAAFHG